MYGCRPAGVPVLYLGESFFFQNKRNFYSLKITSISSVRIITISFEGSSNQSEVTRGALVIRRDYEGSARPCVALLWRRHGGNPTPPPPPLPPSHHLVATRGSAGEARTGSGEGGGRALPPSCGDPVRSVAAAGGLLHGVDPRDVGRFLAQGVQRRWRGGGFSVAWWVVAGGSWSVGSRSGAATALVAGGCAVASQMLVAGPTGGGAGWCSGAHGHGHRRLPPLPAAGDGSPPRSTSQAGGFASSPPMALLRRSPRGSDWPREIRARQQPVADDDDACGCVSSLEASSWSCPCPSRAPGESLGWLTS
ncbi:uncharacterized protein [Triticum aestivum]|uniref:uncharacterized protein n=1 Tax=Triticum aestivum TaxID=4565 RepID=UPI001D01EC90|nr:uncharacterized protein LOC123191648 [Triticum aestivum]